MKIFLPKPAKATTESDLLIAGAFKTKPDDKKASAKAKPKNSVFEACKTIKELDTQIAGYLISSACEEGFKADEGQVFSTSSLGKSKAKAIALLGLGDHHTQSVDLFRRSGGEAYKLAQKKRAKKLSYVIPEKTTVPLFDVVQALAEGIRLASYTFNRYHTKDKKENYVKEIEIHLPEDPTAEQKLALTRAHEIAESVCLARDLINEGPMELNPEAFAKHAAEVAKECDLEIDILDEKKLKKEKMNLMLAVGSAAQNISPPRLIRLHYKPKKPSKRVIALVGKGVTFDSGGLDIKPADGMLDMKVDMSGAAAVLGAMRAIAKLEANIEVVGYMGCVENGVGPHAYHPGDILVSRKGTTVEIGNTDAEGRLVLADCMDYAQERDKPDTIIDVATLTGACMVALGTKTAGIFSNDDALCDAICQSGKAVGESYWRLPLLPELKDAIKSPVADIKNIGERWGGSITAALFLEEFVKGGVKWAHLDIAGPATNSKAHPYLSNGGSGFAVRTLVDYLMGQK
jgi:leucyl aminopeptidase